jgi:hypothetical protein
VLAMYGTRVRVKHNTFTSSLSTRQRSSSPETENTTKYGLRESVSTRQKMDLRYISKSILRSYRDYSSTPNSKTSDRYALS